jgi:hypothetical protein
MSVEGFKAHYRARKRESHVVASAIATACAQGDVDAFFAAVNQARSVYDPWPLTFRKISKLPAVSPEMKRAFVPVWIEFNMLPIRVGNRPVLARALRLLLPGGYEGAPLKLYRGAAWRERCRRRYGFSWTTDRETARNFAEQRRPDCGQKDPGGVILRTIAPREAVLLIRKRVDYYDEGEVVVDPFRLGFIDVVERLEPRRASSARMI